MSNSEAIPNFFTNGPAKDQETSYNHRKRMRYQSSLSFLLNNMGGDENVEDENTREDEEGASLEREKKRLLLLVETARPVTTVDSQPLNVDSEDVSQTLDEDRAFLDKIKSSCGNTSSPIIGPVMPATMSNPLIEHTSSTTISTAAMDHTSSTPISTAAMDHTAKPWNPDPPPLTYMGSDPTLQSDTISKPECRFSLTAPTLKKTTVTPYSSHPNNFLKGCKWSPDGLALLTCSEDRVLRLYGVPDLSSDAEQTPTLSHQMSGLIYDYCWSPLTNHFTPDTCTILATAKYNPVHMIDGFTGKVKASYRVYDKCDELTSAFSVTYSRDCSKVLAGFCKEIHVFDVNRPGRDSTTIPVSVEGMDNNSIVSTITEHPASPGLYAAGCYNAWVSLYSEHVSGPVAHFEGPKHGVTQLMFSSSGEKLYCGSRMEEEIYCFDTRWTNNVLYTMVRSVDTNQRIYFDIDSTHSVLVSGNSSGVITMYDLSSPLSPPLSFPAHNDTCNGVALHPHWNLLATGSGRRHCHVGEEEEEENSLKIWAFSSSDKKRCHVQIE